MACIQTPTMNSLCVCISLRPRIHRGRAALLLIHLLVILRPRRSSSNIRNILAWGQAKDMDRFRHGSRSRSSCDQPQLYSPSWCTTTDGPCDLANDTRSLSSCGRKPCCTTILVHMAIWIGVTQRGGQAVAHRHPFNVTSELFFGQVDYIGKRHHQHIKLELAC